MLELDQAYLFVALTPVWPALGGVAGGPAAAAERPAGGARWSFGSPRSRCG
jgi:hypothetical protein